MHVYVLFKFYGLQTTCTIKRRDVVASQTSRKSQVATS